MGKSEGKGEIRAAHSSTHASAVSFELDVTMRRVRLTVRHGAGLRSFKLFVENKHE